MRMKLFVKSVLCMSLTFLIIFTCITPSSYALNVDEVSQALSNSVALFIGSPLVYSKDRVAIIEPANFDVYPIVKDDRTLIPIRIVSEAMGAKVEWDQKANTATITSGSNKAVFTPDRNVYLLNGAETKLDVAAQDIGGRLFVPLRKLAEDVLGQSIFYDDGLIIIGSNSDIQNLNVEIIANIKSMLTKDGTHTWYPFTVPWDDQTDNAINIGKLTLDAPAGKHGFLKVKDGHFYFEDGTKMRFWGTNLSGAANFPTHENAEKMAAHIAKFGFNIVRLHHMDSNYEPAGIFSKKNKDTSILSEEQLDRLDYLIYQLNLKGIYVDINLHVGRKFTDLDGVTDATNLPRNSKQVTLFDPKLIELQKKYAEQLLGHYNPYAKLKYTENPGVALVETTNENSLFLAWVNGALFGGTNDPLPEYYAKELDEKWSAWLRNKYGSTEKLQQAWAKGAKIQGKNLLNNSGFESGLDGWVKEVHDGSQADFSIDTKEKYSGQSSLKAQVAGVVENGSYTVQFKQLGIKLKKGVSYTMRFKAKADNTRKMTVSCGMDNSPWTNMGLSSPIQLSTNWEEYTASFNAKSDTDEKTRLSFVLGMSTGTVWIDDVEFFESGETVLYNNESLGKGSVNRVKWSDRFLYSPQRMADNTEFYYDVERAYFKEMQDYIHREIGIKVPLSTTNNYYGNPDLMAQNEGDYIDAHGYWDHPGFPDKLFDKSNFKQNNLSMIKEGSFINNTSGAFNSSPIIRFSMSAIEGKPLVISEWNDVFPNNYDYEEANMLAAYALLQDWDGLFIYTFSSSADWNKESMKDWFTVVNNSGKMSQMPASALAFIRGDFNKANKKLLIQYNKNDILMNYRDFGSSVGFNVGDQVPITAAYTHAIRKAGFNTQPTELKGDKPIAQELESPSSEYLSDTGEIQWNSKTNGNEYIKFNTANFQGAVGFLGGTMLECDNLKMKLLTDGSLSLISLDGKSIAKSGKMLLSAVARQRNTGQIRDEKNGLADWGTGPMIMEPVLGSIKIKVDAAKDQYSVYSLDAKGERVSKVPMTTLGDALEFVIGEHNTPWYEIVKE